MINLITVGITVLMVFWIMVCFGNIRPLAVPLFPWFGCCLGVAEIQIRVSSNHKMLIGSDLPSAQLVQVSVVDPRFPANARCPLLITAPANINCLLPPRPELVSSTLLTASTQQFHPQLQLKSIDSAFPPKLILSTHHYDWT